MKLYAKLLGLGKGLEKVCWILQYVKDKSVLDLGCIGEDDITHSREYWLHGHIAQVAKLCLGLDSNKEAIEGLRSLNYEIVAGDAQNFKFEHEFDVIVAADILEHLDDMKGFFSCVRESLQDQGLLILTTPNPWFFLRFLRCLWKGDGGVHPEHVHWFCFGSIEELLRRYGFKILKIEYGSSEKVFYKLGHFRPVLFHTSIFVAAQKAI